MIAIEEIKQFRNIDLIAIFLFSLFWAVVMWLTDKSTTIPTYIVALTLTSLLLVFLVLLVRKAFTAILFFTIGSIILLFTGALIWREAIGYILAGGIFELVYLILKLEIKNIPIDVVLGSATAVAASQLFIALLLSVSVAGEMPLALINVVLLAFFVGLAGAVAGFLIWYKLSVTKLVLRFEYS